MNVVPVLSNLTNDERRRVGTIINRETAERKLETLKVQQ